MTFIEFLKRFPDEKACIDHYIKIRYPEGVHCNHCGSPRVYQRKNPKVFDCKDCYNSFSPFKDTIFEHSPTEMGKWFYAIHLFLNGKKGISAMQLQREIGVTYKTAWRMLQQIRKAMGNAKQKQLYDTIIEMDEVYIGGKPRKDNDHHDGEYTGGGEFNKRGKGTKKTPIVGAIDRVNKRVIAKVILPDKNGKKLTFKQLLDALSVVSRKPNRNTLITDEYSGYNHFGAYGYYHLTVNHRDLFADGDTHTNNIESFWATLKRGVYGIYHHVSVKHMQGYVDEFCFRYNNRENDMFSMVLGQARI